MVFLRLSSFVRDMKMGEYTVKSQSWQVSSSGNNNMPTGGGSSCRTQKHLYIIKSKESGDDFSSS